MKSKTLTIVGPRESAIFENDVPGVGPGEIKVQNLYSGISAGTEMHVYRGIAPQFGGRLDPETRLFVQDEAEAWHYPLVYGYAAVGRVADVGEGVDGFAVGELVFTPTPHQEWVVVEAGAALKLPELANPRRGVFAFNINTALNGVLDAHPSLGDVLVVSGLGVIGLLALQIARRTGPSILIAVDPDPTRRQQAVALGADHVLDAPGAAERIHDITGGAGADTVLEISGNPHALHEAIRMVRYEGTVVAVSWYAQNLSSVNLAGEFHHNRVRILSSQSANVNPSLHPRWTKRRREQFSLTLLESLDLNPLLTHDFAIDDAPAGYRLVDQAPPGLVQATINYKESEN